MSDAHCFDKRNNEEQEGYEISENSPQCLRKIFIIKLFGLVGTLFTLPFGLLSLYHGNVLLGVSLLLVALLLITNYYLVTTKSYYSMGANTIVYLFMILFLYLVYSGGVSSTGALWIYSFPALALFLHGLRQGIIDIIIFMLIIIFMFININDSFLLADYSDEFKLRLLFSFLVVIFLSSLYEYSNAKSFDDMKILTQKLINVAKQDQLTELANRRGISEEMEEIYKHAKVNGEHLCVMLCDIDFFDDIKYGYGQEVADLVIKEIALEIQHSINNTHTVARWSGEEFLILLPETKLNDAYRFAGALEKRIENLIIKHGNQRIKVTVSTGISDVENVKSIYSAVRRADNEMYKSKNTQQLT